MAENDYDKFAEKYAALAADLPHARVIPAIDKHIEILKQQWLDLLHLRDIAVRKHGETSKPPAMIPFAGMAQPASENVQPREIVNLPWSKSGIVTVSDLAQRYMEDERSAFHSVRFKTRVHYDTLIKQIKHTAGDISLANLKAPNVEALYSSWADGKKAMGHALLTMFRAMVYFGANILEDEQCVRLAVLLRTMRISPVASGPIERLTREHVHAIIAKAYEIERPSMALAQALQFEFSLHQKDVLGEWVPVTEPGEVYLVDGNQKWLRGIKWEEIDQDMILHHTESRTQEQLTLDLKSSRLVMDELNKMTQRLKSRGKSVERGPVILCERTDQPWTTQEFRRYWRKIADEAGIPKGVKNGDSRMHSDDAE